MSKEIRVTGTLTTEEALAFTDPSLSVDEARPDAERIAEATRAFAQFIDSRPELTGGEISVHVPPGFTPRGEAEPLAPENPSPAAAADTPAAAHPPTGATISTAEDKPLSAPLSASEREELNRLRAQVGGSGGFSL